MKKISLFLVLFVFLAVNVNATPVTITYTADNVVNSWYEQTGNGRTYFDLGPNNGNWQQADSLVLDLNYGQTYTFIWELSNEGAFTNGNPAAFLAEIDFIDLDSIVTSSEWMVRIGGNPAWVSATEYGLNGGNNIWTNVNGGPIADIDQTAQWIWSDTNFAEGELGHLLIKTTFTPVPEPATLFLLGSGILGFAGYRKKRLNK